MKEIIILSKDPYRSKTLQAIMENIFPECKTRVLAPGVEVPLIKKGDAHGKCPDER
jgi:hypothetical protein